MDNITPNQIYKNYRRRSFEVHRVDIPSEIADLLDAVYLLARALKSIDADWGIKVRIELYNLMEVIIMSLQEYDFQVLQSCIPEETHDYVTQYPDLTMVWEAFQRTLGVCAEELPINNKRSEAIAIIEDHRAGTSAILQLPSLDRNIRDEGLCHASYIWKMSQLPEITPHNLIIPGSVWKRREGLLDLALLGGYSQNIYQLQYNIKHLEFSLEQRSSIRHFPVLKNTFDASGDENTMIENIPSSPEPPPDQISSLFESTQSAVWNGLYTALGSSSDGSMEDVRLCLLRGNMVVPLRINADVVTVRDDGSFIYKDVTELEPEDRFILPAEGYADYRNSVTDQYLQEKGHPELRGQTEEWKEMVREAIKRIGGAEEFCSWCKEYGLSIANPGYAWCYTTDQVMLPRDIGRFKKLMNACYLILERDIEETSIKTEISKYWQSTKRLKSARRELDKSLNEQRERIVKEQLQIDNEVKSQPATITKGQFQMGLNTECQPITLDDHTLWNIWTVSEVGSETVSVPYSRVEVPRRI